MLNIVIDEEVSSVNGMEWLLEEILKQVRNGNTSGVYPSWSLEGEEEESSEE